MTGQRAVVSALVLLVLVSCTSGERATTAADEAQERIPQQLPSGTGAPACPKSASLDAALSASWLRQLQA
jgi:hypothetical protein